MAGNPSDTPALQALQGASAPIPQSGTEVRVERHG